MTAHYGGAFQNRRQCFRQPPPSQDGDRTFAGSPIEQPVGDRCQPDARYEQGVELQDQQPGSAGNVSERLGCPVLSRVRILISAPMPAPEQGRSRRRLRCRLSPASVRRCGADLRRAPAARSDRSSIPASAPGRSDRTLRLPRRARWSNRGDPCGRVPPTRERNRYIKHVQREAIRAPIDVACAGSAPKREGRAHGRYVPPG